MLDAVLRELLYNKKITTKYYDLTANNASSTYYINVWNTNFKATLKNNQIKNETKKDIDL